MWTRSRSVLFASKKQEKPKKGEGTRDLEGRTAGGLRRLVLHNEAATGMAKDHRMVIQTETELRIKGLKLSPLHKKKLAP